MAQTHGKDLSGLRQGVRALRGTLPPPLANTLSKLDVVCAWVRHVTQPGCCLLYTSPSPRDS
eukprot:2016880-Prorocentrum_lima.AAC.1